MSPSDELNGWLFQMKQEKRSASRFAREPGTEYASVVHPPECARLVEIADESLGGLGLALPSSEAECFYVGRRLEIAYAGAQMEMVVRHVTCDSDGRTIVGLQECVAE